MKLVPRAFSAGTQLDEQWFQIEIQEEPIPQSNYSWILFPQVKGPMLFLMIVNYFSAGKFNISSLNI